MFSTIWEFNFLRTKGTTGMEAVLIIVCFEGFHSGVTDYLSFLETLTLRESQLKTF